MDPQIKEILSEVRGLSDKTARIETHIEYQKEQLERIEHALASIEHIKAKVQTHDTKITAFSWFFGVILTTYVARVVTGL